MNLGPANYTLRIPLTGNLEPLSAEVKIAVPYWKPEENKSGIERPDFSVEEIHRIRGRRVWIDFPWEQKIRTPA